MTDRQRMWYEDKLTAFCAGKGQRYALTNPLTYVAAALGISAEEVIEDCRATMPDFTSKHASDIRRGIASAQSKVITRPIKSCRPPQQEPQPSFPDKVRSLIAAGGMKATMEDLTALSPTDVKFNHRGYQTDAFLRRLWRPEEYLHVEDSQHHVLAALGLQLRSCAEWLELLRRRPLSGDIIGRNPYSGNLGHTGAGQTSYVSADCISRFRFALIEFDALPIPEQCAFWLGVIRTMPRFAVRLASLVFSGEKSIHGLLRIDGYQGSPQTLKRDMMRLFCSDPDKSYRADPSGFIPRGGTRLAGAKRRSNGEIQTLLYLT